MQSYKLDKEVRETVEKYELEKINTCDLVGELKRREGVECITAVPYKKESILVEGPAVILVVQD